MPTNALAEFPHHVIRNIFGSVALGVKLEGDHLVAVGLQLAFHHVVPAAGYLCRQQEQPEYHLLISQAFHNILYLEFDF